MRIFGLMLAGALGACAMTPMHTATTTLVAADAATALAAGQQLTMTIETPGQTPPEGEDPVILMRLRNSEGRLMSFDQSNHAPMHVMAQGAGGPLAQVMGLFGDERPTLYGARRDENEGAPFFCGESGPVALGYYEGADGAIQIVGLSQEFGFESRPDGSYGALPYSPDQVCARLRFRRQ
ncbi:MAG: hypothetical protein R3C25_01080 [Hyphomonadaceae bacterium]